MKRTVALALLALVGGGLLASFLALRTEWAGTRLCALAGRVVGRETGLPLAVASCEIDPLRLELAASGVRLGPAEAPVFSAARVRVRLAPVQALGARLHVAEAELVRPRLALALPPRPDGAPGGRCPPDALGKLELRALRIEDGSASLTLPSGARLEVGRIDVAAEPVAVKPWRALGGPARARISVAVDGATFEDGARRIAAAEVRAAGELAVDLSRLELREAAARGEGWELGAHGVVEDLCAPRLQLDVSAKAPLPLLAALAGRDAGSVSGAVEARARVDGPPADPALRGEVRLLGARLGRWVPGDARARVALRGRELRVEGLEVPGRGGLVRGRARLRLEEGLPLDAEVDLDRVELAEVLERTGLPGAWVLLRVSGRARIGGTLSPLALAGSGGLDLADFQALSHSWETLRPGERPVLELRTARLDAGVRVTRESVRIEDGRLRAGGETLRADAELFLSSERGFAVRVDGGADLDLLGHVAGAQLGGRARVRGTVRAAPYGNPRIEAEVSVAGLRFLELDLGEAAARASYGPEGHVLRLDAIEGRRGETRYDAATAIDLRASPPEVLEGRLAARGRLRDLFEAVMPWLPSARIVRDALDGAVEVTATARGPATALDAEFAGTLGAGAVLGRPFDGGAVAGRVEDGARAVFRRVQLDRAGGAARASGTWAFAAPHPWDLEAGWTDLPLGEALGAPEAWAGRTGGTARLRGSLAVPDVRLLATAEGAAVGGVPLRDGRAEGRIEGEALALDATAEGLRLAATARLVGDGPFRATVDLAHDDAGRLFRREGARGARLRVEGRATADGVLTDVAGARAEVALARLEASYSDFRVANDGPVSLGLAARRLEVRPFLLRGTNTALTVSGAVAPGGALALDLAGTLDLRILGDSVPRVTGTQGLLSVEARVGGTLAAPLLVGSGRLASGGFRFADVPIAFTGLAGDLAFSQNRVVFDRLAGAVNGGAAELSGEAELVKLFPERLRVRAAVDEVPLRIPAWLPSVVTGRLTVEGGWDAMDVAGRLHVTRARYTENLELERSALELRRRAAAERPYDPAGEWLRFDVALVVDGDARVENDVVRGAVGGEVTLTGTLGAPGLVGTLALAEGSRATFRGNEFSLTHAVVDFTERRRVRMHLDVNGQTQVDEYQVFMHLFGPYDEPVLQLTSQPALTQEDLVALLSLGFTTRDAAQGGVGGGVATAAAAQALFSVSGLDEQVRRFLPRGGPFRDFTVRMTSAYSEGTGQVEPRAEFESKLLEDRLRVRWQAPLSGARGQRAQAELKVGGRTSVQYQWENDNPDVATGGDHGLDLKLRWEWND